MTLSQFLRDKPKVGDAVLVKDVEVALDEKGDPVLDENGNPVVVDRLTGEVVEGEVEEGVNDDKPTDGC